MRVLIIEDNGPLREALRQGLEEAGFAVDASDEGEEGLWYARSNEHDAIVLDLMLPNIDGLTILSCLRREGSAVPILILTARDTVADRVKGLNLGADDYLVKPFAFAELLARVRAMVRRGYNNKDPVIRVGDLEIDTAGRAVRRGDQAIDLSAREYALLEFLAARADQVVSRTAIWEHIYDFNSDPESNVVDVHIGHLRKKIEQPGQPKLIHTRRGQGYLLGRCD
ncbi:MAG: response regulator transcription factor [Phycisphaerae bacterium]|nr:response regulator transcription factor [Phycisphaerae bacterium]